MASLREALPHTPLSLSLSLSLPLFLCELARRQEAPGLLHDTIVSTPFGSKSESQCYRLLQCHIMNDIVNCSMTHIVNTAIPKVCTWPQCCLASSCDLTKAPVARRHTRRRRHGLSVVVVVLAKGDLKGRSQSQSPRRRGSRCRSVRSIRMLLDPGGVGRGGAGRELCAWCGCGGSWRCLRTPRP